MCRTGHCVSATGQWVGSFPPAQSVGNDEHCVGGAVEQKVTASGHWVSIPEHVVVLVGSAGQAVKTSGQLVSSCGQVVVPWGHSV